MKLREFLFGIHPKQKRLFVDVGTFRTAEQLIGKGRRNAKCKRPQLLIQRIEGCFYDKVIFSFFYDASR